MADGERILIAGGLLAAGLLMTLVAGRVRVPGLVLVLVVGMFLGSDASGLIEFDDYELARTIGVISLSLILFEGGLAAGWRQIRPVLVPSLSLALLGTLATAVVTGLAAAALFDFSTLEGLLLGAILASTDGAAVFAVLRGSSLRRRVAHTLEGEAGFNDPVAVLLVLGFVEWILHPDYGVGEMAELFVRQLGLGLAVGLLVGRGAQVAFRRLRLATPGLYPVASLTTAALAYGGADVIEGSGFLAVYLAGLMLGGERLPAGRTVVAFHEGLAWVAQLAMFLTLGLLVFPSQLGNVAVEGTLLAIVLVFVARPLAAAAATAFTGFSWAERAVLGWAGLRGAVPVVLATFPLIAGVPQSLEFFNIVFFAVLLSTVLQGTTFEWVARRLGVTTDEPALPLSLVEVGTIHELGAEVIEVPIREGDAAVGARIRDLGLPRDALVMVLVRGDEALLPRGSTRVEAGDILHVLVRSEVAQEARELVRRWRDGPVGAPVRPRRRMTGTVPVFTMRPWSEEDGNPAHPQRIGHHDVVEHLRTRRDVPGALVVLEDGRYAASGPLLVMGPRQQLQEHARRLLRQSADDAEAAWWQEVIGACAL